MIEEFNLQRAPELLKRSEELIRIAWGPEIDSKLDPALERRIIAKLEGGIESSEKQKVLIYYRPKESVTELKESFESFHHKEMGANRPRSGPEASRMEKQKMMEERAFVKFALEQSAAPLIEGLKKKGVEVVRPLILGNAVVANLTPKQIRDAAQRNDVTWIAPVMPISLELDVSAGSVKLTQALSQNVLGTGKGVVVAVIDGEVDINHPDLKGHAEQKRNYTSESWGNPHPHATHVAGIVAGSGEKFRGMAPGATVWSYKIFASNESESEEGFQGAAAIEDAFKDGAKVINCSWGSSATPKDGSCALCKTAENVTKLGVVLVKSAGNSGPDEMTITCPAAAKGDVIVVGACSHVGDDLMFFSSRGPTADNRPKPDILAPGEGIMSARPGGGYRGMDGTSMAAPHVAGLAALLLEKRPELKPWQIKKAMMDKAKHLDNFSDNEQGRGVVDILEAAKAVEGPAQPAPAEEDIISCTMIKEAARREMVSVLLKNAGQERILEVSANSCRRTRMWR